jgi:hypothetical protein
MFGYFFMRFFLQISSLIPKLRNRIIIEIVVGNEKDETPFHKKTGVCPTFLPIPVIYLSGCYHPHAVKFIRYIST